MKVGIMTFHNAINYGAVLQTYALQRVIESLGVRCEVIDYECKHIKNNYKILGKKHIKSTKGFVASIVLLPIKINKTNKFKKFQKRYIKLSNNIDSREKLKFLNNEYDKFITGSDQVWNLSCTGRDSSYFLDFVTDIKKKNSYAASFGVSDIPINEKKEYKKLLNDFNHISVRENQGKDIIYELLSKEGQVNIDPTLILNKNEWMQLSKKSKFKHEYILIYLMEYSESIIKFAENLSKITGYKIKYINSSLTKRVNGEYIRTAGPIEFLSLFVGARYIVTNSFHGTAFSVNFNKEFFVELLPPPAKVNSRLENIMDLLDLRERQIIDGKNSNIDKPINYSKVNELLDKEREKSKKYLKMLVENGND